jgi:hypothetical protein
MFEGLIPGVGSLNIRALDTPLFAVGKRIYDQVQSYYDDKMNAQNTKALMSQRISAANQPGEINNFMSTIRNGGVAKPNMYSVMMFPPKAVDSKRSELYKTTSMLCESASFPSINILTSQFRTYGPFIEMPYIRVNEPITLTFITDAKMSSKVLFDEWMDMIINPDTNNVRLYSDFVGTITLMQKSQETSDEVYSITLLNAYPKVVHEMPLSYSETGSYHKVVVQFVYEKLINVQVNIATPYGATTVRGMMDKVSGLDKIKSVINDKVSGIKQSAGDLYNDIKNKFPKIGG